MIGLGIDTGGTCTDAVLFDLEERRVLSTGKTATTKDNLERGIETALTMLDERLLSQVSLVSLSTTLATNACVEGRGGRVKLLLIGIDEKTAANTYETYGFSSMDDFVFLPGEPAEGKEPDFERLEQMAHQFDGCSGIAVSQVFAGKNGGLYEKKAREILSRHFDVPIICAYSMFSDLNAIKRGAGAFLNARLIPLIEDFLCAVKAVLRQRNLNAPIYIVRSDGSLMNEAFTRLYPVETLLCGPASSALGGAYLADVSDGLIIDIGGTTTDVAVIRGHALRSVRDGIAIGSWKTFVKGMDIDTFGLGGDTALRLVKHRLVLEDYRIMPVCMAVSRHPELKEKIVKACLDRTYSWIAPYEGFVCLHSPDGRRDYTENEKRLANALREGPLLLEEAAKAYGTDYYLMDTSRLEQEGMILRFGLTPTDMMHVRGDFTAYDGEVSDAALTWLARRLRTKKEQLLNRIFHKAEKRLYINLVRILLKHGSPEYQKQIPAELLDFVAHTFESSAFEAVTPSFHTDLTLIGVGAPTHVFLPNVAKKLHARCILPENAAVANALGTLAGRVSSTRRAEISFCTDEGYGYRVFLDGEQRFFEEYEDAEAAAEESLKKMTAREVVGRGGSGDVEFAVERDRLDPDLDYGSFVMGSVVTVTAYAFPQNFTMDI